MSGEDKSGVGDESMVTDGGRRTADSGRRTADGGRRRTAENSRGRQWTVADGGGHRKQWRTAADGGG